MFKLMDKKIFTILLSKFCLSKPVTYYVKERNSYLGTAPEINIKYELKKNQPTSSCRGMSLRFRPRLKTSVIQLLEIFNFLSGVDSLVETSSCLS